MTMIDPIPAQTLANIGETCELLLAIIRTLPPAALVILRDAPRKIREAQQ